MEAKIQFYELRIRRVLALVTRSNFISFAVTKYRKYLFRFFSLQIFYFMNCDLCTTCNGEINNSIAVKLISCSTFRSSLSRRLCCTHTQQHQQHHEKKTTIVDKECCVRLVFDAKATYDIGNNVAKSVCQTLKCCNNAMHCTLRGVCVHFSPVMYCTAAHLYIRKVFVVPTK